jgi:hypothetical protein
LEQRKKWSQVLVAHVCNPNYLGGRYQRTEVQSQPKQIVHEILSQKSLSQKKCWWSGSSSKSTFLVSVRLEFKSQCYKKIESLKNEIEGVKKSHIDPGVVAYTCKPSTQEAEAVELKDGSHPGLHSKFEVS